MGKQRQKLGFMVRCAYNNYYICDIQPIKHIKNGGRTAFFSYFTTLVDKSNCQPSA